MLGLTIVFYSFVDFKVIYNLYSKKVKGMVEGFSITGSKWVEKFGWYFFVCSDLSRYFPVSFQTV